MKIDFLEEKQYIGLLEKNKSLDEYIPFYCGPCGCPFIKKNCDPDSCGNYWRYKTGFMWKPANE
jgi:hypothetical protein